MMMFGGFHWRWPCGIPVCYLGWTVAFSEAGIASSIFKVLDSFHSYDRTSSLESVNEASKELFCKKNKALENPPSTAVS